MDALRSSELARRYAETLERFLVGAEETALYEVYLLGRKACEAGIGVLDIAMLHHQALAAAARAPGGIDHDRLTRAGTVLGESLASFEMALRGYRETDERLIEANESLAEAQANVERGEETRSALLATIAHRMRTAMSAMIGFNEALLRTNLSVEQRHLALTVREGAEGLLAILNDVLDLSKLSGGTFVVEQAPFRLRSVVERCVEASLPQANEKHIDVVCTIAPDVPDRLIGDAGRLHQILTQLLSNAVAFTQEGEVELRLSTLERDERDVTVLFEVEDTGIGMGEELQQQLVTSRPGLGLGMCKELVERLGGTMSVWSAVGVGSTFRFTSRFSLDDVPAVVRYVDRLNGFWALVVNPDVLHREILIHQMAAWGMICRGAASVSDAIDVIAALPSDTRFGVAVVDVDTDLAQRETLARALQNGGTRTLMLAPAGGAALGKLYQLDVDGRGPEPIDQSGFMDALIEILAPSARTDVRPPSATSPATARAVRVLVAEDSATLRELASIQLAALGYQADFVDDGAAALDAWTERRYGIVLMDCLMPEMDGYEATLEIRRREVEGEHTVVIALTANASSSEREKCLATGMDDFLTKPLAQEHLAEILAKWERVIAMGFMPDDL